MATAKLTLAIEEGIIERMKDYANARRSSVSRLVENYFVYLTSQTPKEEHAQISVSPFIKGLTVKAMVGKVPKNFDPEEEIAHYLEEKYK